MCYNRCTKQGWISSLLAREIIKEVLVRLLQLQVEAFNQSEKGKLKFLKHEIGNDCNDFIFQCANSHSGASSYGPWCVVLCFVFNSLPWEMGPSLVQMILKQRVK